MSVRLLVALALFCMPLLAQSAEIDAEKSSFTWKATKVTGAHEGKIFPKSGTVELKDGAIEKGEVVMDLTTFTVTDLQGEWAQKLLGHLKSDDFFNVAQFPTAKLTFGKVVDNVVRGQLTIKDKTNPVMFKLVPKDGVYAGTLTFDRTKFGMIYKSGNFFKDLGDKAINDEVTLEFNVALKAAK